VSEAAELDRIRNQRRKRRQIGIGWVNEAVQPDDPQMPPDRLRTRVAKIMASRAGEGGGAGQFVGGASGRPRGPASHGWERSRRPVRVRLT
jgi:hypothetical protein